ncbi:Hypothetical protein R9X50_00417800 [Acrodontium crateriforme]|uniref:N-acetylgalactosaminide beta-1,3-galactosyltransferase n=1 Tax=Acrodontium crateriforme TaxID=150365 RepID=A0AAQ3MAK0_9PEZI|nr:Hypothetical protein R9X50_00417800 [Acrodontium crateriforme]
MFFPRDATHHYSFLFKSAVALCIGFLIFASWGLMAFAGDWRQLPGLGGLEGVGVGGGGGVIEGDVIEGGGGGAVDGGGGGGGGIIDGNVSLEGPVSLDGPLAPDDGVSLDDVVPLPSPSCIPTLPNHVIISKTGATEAQARVPIQLDTSLFCSDTVIFSDMADTIAGHEIHDVLADFTPDVRDSNPEFDIYRKQYELLAEGKKEQIPDLKKWPVVGVQDFRTAGKSASWGLDKYKNILAAFLSWKLRPEQDWYIFIDADTYLSQNTLRAELAKHDPREVLYLGHSLRMLEHPTELYFAHGGSGYVLSRAAMEKAVLENPALKNEWDAKIINMWFGDYVFAAAMDSINISLTDGTPMFNGLNALSLPLGPAPGSWCQNVITLHHMEAEQFKTMYEYEQRNNFAPLRFKDIYQAFYPSGIPTKRDEWNNLADDDQFRLSTDEFLEPGILPGNSSFDACQLACTRDSSCLQFMFERTRESNMTKCHRSNVLRLGKKKDLANSALVECASGWMVERFESWIHEHENC